MEKAPECPKADGEAVVPSKDLMMLTPEKSMEIQNAIGADIMMQLDDVVCSTTTGPRVEEAMNRSEQSPALCIVSESWFWRFYAGPYDGWNDADKLIQDRGNNFYSQS